MRAVVWGQSHLQPPRLKLSKRFWQVIVSVELVEPQDQAAGKEIAESNGFEREENRIYPLSICSKRYNGAPWGHDWRI